MTEIRTNLAKRLTYLSASIAALWTISILAMLDSIGARQQHLELASLKTLTAFNGIYDRECAAYGNAGKPGRRWLAQHHNALYKNSLGVRQTIHHWLKGLDDAICATYETQRDQYAERFSAIAVPLSDEEIALIAPKPPPRWMRFNETKETETLTVNTLIARFRALFEPRTVIIATQICQDNSPSMPHRKTPESQYPQLAAYFIETGSKSSTGSGVDMIAFTGSREVGCRIIENARRLHPQRHSFKHVVAEMGGKNAIIIDDDADIDEAVQATIASAFGYSGQKCTACSRIIVLKSAYKAYLSKLVEAAEAIQPAAADLPGTTIGPLIDAEALERTRRYIEHGKEQARCILEGRLVRDENGAHFMAPSIFADVPPDARIAVEEIMAPVLAVMCAETFEHAVELANNTPYALTGGVYSRSPANIETAKRRLNAGMIYVNRKITLSRVDRQPFGGFNLSGLGTKTGGPDYLQQFTLPKTVSENTMRHGFSPANVSGEKPPKAATV